MEELLIKYLENKCTAEELAEVTQIFNNDAQLKAEVDAMRKMDNLLVNNFVHAPNPALANKIKTNLHASIETNRDYSDFILPGLFLLGSLVYFIINFGNFSTETSPFDLHQYSVYINIGFVSMTGILLLYFFDQFLSNRKKSDSLRMFSF